MYDMFQDGLIDSFSALLITQGDRACVHWKGWVRSSGWVRVAQKDYATHGLSSTVEMTASKALASITDRGVTAICHL